MSWLADVLIMLGLIALCVGIYLWRRRKANAETSAVPAIPTSPEPVEALPAARTGQVPPRPFPTAPPKGTVTAAPSSADLSDARLRDIVLPTMHYEPSLAAVASIAAAVPPAADPAPAGSAVPVASQTTVPSTVRETPSLQENHMAEQRSYPPKVRPPTQPNLPSAILVLRDFKTYAAAVQNFLDLPTVPEKFTFWIASARLLPFQDYLGMSAGWINALSYDGLANGVLLVSTHFDKAANKLVINGVPVDHPTLGWATGDDQPPPYYKPLKQVTASGADIVAAFLKAAMQSSYLRGLGLTDEAIAAARA